MKYLSENGLGYFWQKVKTYILNLLNEKISGTVLYEDETGTKGNVTLADNAENYDEIEIYYKTSARSGSIKISDFNSKNLVLPIVATSTSNAVILTKEVQVSGTTITKRFETQFSQHITNGRTYTETDTIYIYKVVGYKY